MITSDRDILVTTAKKDHKLAIEEAAKCIAEGGGSYFRTFRRRPNRLEIGSRIFYVDLGFIVGFAMVNAISQGLMTCDVSKRTRWGWHAIMDARSWQWIKPILHKGFQGFRYFGGQEIEIIGNWLDPMPEI